MLKSKQLMLALVFTFFDLQKGGRREKNTTIFLERNLNKTEMLWVSFAACEKSMLLQLFH